MLCTAPDTPLRLVAFEDLGSTNDEAMGRLRAGDPGELWIVAERQTGGRGRHGRSWQSPPGNLYASLALRLDIPPVVAPQLGFVAGVALFRALKERLPNEGGLQIKWPNDMVVGGAKLAGLLLESSMLADGRLGCVIGFGVNCRSHPQDLAYPATDLAACGDPYPEPRLVLTALAGAMARQKAVWNKGLHFETIRSSWLDACFEIGTRLKVVLASGHAEGEFRGIDPAGRLLLETNDGILTIEAGDVFLPNLTMRVREKNLPAGV